MQRDEGVKRDRLNGHTAASQPQRLALRKSSLGGGYAKTLLNASRV
jgi:hypothetical protein